MRRPPFGHQHCARVRDGDARGTAQTRHSQEQAEGHCAKLIAPRHAARWYVARRRCACYPGGMPRPRTARARPGARLGLVLVGAAAFGSTAACTRGPAEAPQDPAPQSPAAAGNEGAGRLGADALARDDPPGTYLGRTLAPTMTHHGAGWLTRPERDDEENTTAMHAQLGLEAGQTACDLGAGNGYHTLKMAEAVAPGGRAVAVDIQPEMLALLQARAKEADVDNVELVLGEPSDPKLPPGTCDLVLLVDVYHELDDPAAVLGHLREALTPRGRIALLEFRAEDPEVPIKELHKMSREQILREYEANGLRLDAEYRGLPWQHMMFFVPAGAREG